MIQRIRTHLSHGPPRRPDPTLSPCLTRCSHTTILPRPLLGNTGIEWGTVMSYIRGLVTIWDGQGDNFFFAELLSDMLKLAVIISSQIPLFLPIP